MQPSAKNGFTICTFCCLLAVVALLCACSRHDDRLRAADAVLEDDPAQALQMLDSIHANALVTDDYPYYCLLYTQAQVKNNIVVDNDSLIAVAYDAYAHASGNSDMKKRANFYNAQVAYYAKDYRTAMRDILPAYEIAKSQNDPYWTAKAAEIIADIYYDAYNYGQAAIYTRIAADNYLKAGRITSHRYALSDVAVTLLNDGKINIAAHLLDSLMSVIESEQPIDSSLYYYVLEPMQSVYYKTGRYDELAKLLQLEDTTSIPNRRLVDNAILKSYLANSGYEPDNAKIILATAYTAAEDDKQRIRIMYASYKDALANQDYKEAATLSDSLLRMQSRFAGEAISESVAGIQRDHFLQQTIEEKHKYEILRIVLIATALLLILAVLLLTILHKYKLQKKNSEIEAILSSMLSFKESSQDYEDKTKRLENEMSVKDLEIGLKKKELERVNSELNAKKSELNKKTAELNEKNSDLSNMFQNQLLVLNNICDDYFIKGESDTLRDTLVKEIRNQIDRLNSPANLKKLENAANKYRGDVMKILRQECPWMNEGDYKFVLLICAGCSVRTVCLLTGIKQPYYYRKRDMLCKSINENEVPHGQFLIDTIRGGRK